MKSRAIDSNLKQLKKEKFQNMALELLSLGQFPLPSVNQIIQAAGEAKGTFYLYFKSKEEIYMEILTKEFEKFYSEFFIELTKSKKVSEAIVKTFKSFTIKNPKIIYLATITPLILECNLNDEYLLNFKSSLWEITQKISSLISQSSGIEFETSKNNFLISYSLYLSMWQHSNPAPHVQEIISKHNLSGLIYNLDLEFERVIKKIWAK